MSLSASIRRLPAWAHLQLLLRLPTLLAIALRPRRRQAQPSTVRSILLVRLDGLGDCVLTLPLAETLGRCFPKARLTVVTQPSAEPLFTAIEGVDEVLAFRLPLSRRAPKYLRSLLGAWSLYRRSLSGRSFDVAILPRWDADIYHATLLCALVRAATAIGYTDRTSPDKLAMNRGFERAWSVCLPPGPLRHEVLRNLETAAALGCRVDQPALHLPLSAEAEAAARSWLPATADRLLGVGLSSAEAKKRWGAAHYIAALQALQDEAGLSPVLFADGETVALAEEIHAALPGSRLAQAMPLMQVAAVLARCRLFLGNDSGLGHIAAAVGCPTVTIFSQAAETGCDLGGQVAVDQHTSRHSTSPERFRPFGPHAVSLQPTGARPGCAGGCRALEPHCILDVPPRAAVEAALTLLQRTEQPPGHTGASAALSVH